MKMIKLVMHENVFLNIKMLGINLNIINYHYHSSSESEASESLSSSYLLATFMARKLALFKISSTSASIDPS